MHGPLKNQTHRDLRLPQLDIESYASCSQYSVHRIDDQSHSERETKFHITIDTEGTTSPDDALDDILLRAIEPPDHSRLSVIDTLQQLKLTTRRKHCFKQLLVRVNMSLWTLHFKPEYERSYCLYLYEHAIPRIRYAISIALAFTLFKAIYEANNIASDSPLKAEWALVWILHIGVAVPALLAAIACTHIRWFDSKCELYGALPFLVLTIILTTQKVILRTKGPIFAMFLVFVPVFGITRFRLSTTIALVTSMFGVHVLGVLIFQHAETSTDVLFQAYNYFGGIVVGGICQYRAEVLRRRNYVMLLPFSEDTLDTQQMHNTLHDPRLKKHTLMDRSTLKFNNPTVDDAFYRHWYLIDPCPFDHPNAGELHRTVYRSIRFAVGGVIFAQLMLVVQDREYLYSDHHFPHVAYIIATCLRFAIVIPAYGIAPFIMLFCGTRFYWQWRDQASTQDRGGLRSPARSAYNLKSFEVSDTSATPREGEVSETTAYVTLPTPANRATTLDAVQCEPAPFRNNYVRGLQWVSTVVVFCHALAMGVILLLVDQLASQRNASVAPCYFLGFLNALLFPHRSGFRVRFVYATIGTVAVSSIFIAAAIVVHSDKVWTYASYMALTNILGMMVSHEEESLRRIFFVRMMLRSDEFRRRHDAILVLEPWFKHHMRRRRRQRRVIQRLDAAQQDLNDKPNTTSTDSTVRIPTVNQMAQASKVGMSLELGRAAIALLTELV